MLTNNSLDKVLKQARSHVMKGEDTEAKKLYQTTLQDFFREAKKIKQEIIFNENINNNNNLDISSKEEIFQLTQLYNEGKYSLLIEKALTFTKINPQAWMIWNILGATYLQLKKSDSALEALSKVIEINPNYNLGFNNIGVALKEQGKLDEAIQAFKKSILLNPNDSVAYNNLANSFKDQGKHDEALENYNKCIKLDPTYAEAHYNKGIVLKELGMFDRAIQSYNEALTLKPDFVNAYNNIGNIFKIQGKLKEALESFKKTIELKPDHAEAYNNIGITLQLQDKLGDALEAYNTAISIKPDYARAHQNLSYALINSGRLQEGLNKYEWRWKTDEFLSQQRHFKQPIWDGNMNLKDKRILVWSEQGIGDTINWISHLSFISSQAEQCILECQEKLVPLLKRSFQNIKVVPENREFDSKRDDIDFHLPLGSLYKNLPNKIIQNTKIDAYLKPDPVRVKFWQKRLNSIGEGPFVGISWKSATMSPERIPNYFKINDLSPILSIPNVNFINLQNTDYKNDLNKIKNELGVTVHNFDDLDHFDDLDNVAALISALDMVVSNKTTASLISAAVGTKTMLANWRQSSWNNILNNPMGPSVNIFERNTWEKWDNIFSSIAEDIFKLKNSWSKG